jgi:hypothetical protein
MREIPEGDRIMLFERFENWVERYKAAWETRDPEVAESIFTEKATYQVTPFREPEMYRKGIRAYWTRVTTDQRNVQFGSEMIAANGNTGVCRWHCDFDLESEQSHVEIDGIFVFELTDDGLCSQFHEWWHDRIT